VINDISVLIMMKKQLSKVYVLVFCLTVSAALLSCGRTENNLSKEEGSPVDVISKPFRVLVIIGDQWTDPMSYNINPFRVKGEDFLDVVTMLKIWGVPFDILRLDEQRLQINRFLNYAAKPAYGCVIWMADPDKLTGMSANFETLERAVNEYGISMIALFDYIRTDKIANVAGVSYSNVKNVRLDSDGDKFQIFTSHFISADAIGIQLPDSKQLAGSSIPEANGITLNVANARADVSDIGLVNCSVSGNATVLGKIGNIPQLVVRDIDNDTKTVWIGGGRDWFRKYPVMRKLFRKALVYSIGYGVFNDNFENGFICIMDDVGCSEHAWSLTWHYPTPAKDTLIKYLIEPLEKYGKMMVQNITPGFANPEKKLIESSWDVPPFTDIFGNWQDYGSTKEGLDEGLRRGVFEIQPHRAWSHMNWDLDWIESRKDKHWMGFNETCAYLHSEISDSGKDGFGIDLCYDDHYCKYFEKKTSAWTLEFSDTFREALGTGASIKVDGKPSLTGLSAVQKIEIPAGLGVHSLKVVNN
jgi:hypothetical protein